MTVVFLPEVLSDHPRVGYSVGRRVGSAVVRNRVRRRLRAAMRELDREGAGFPAGAYVVVARPEAATVRYGELKESLTAACGAVTAGLER